MVGTSSLPGPELGEAHEHIIVNCFAAERPSGARRQGLRMLVPSPGLIAYFRVELVSNGHTSTYRSPQETHAAASELARSVLISRIGGEPKKRLYSRLN
jgi:hypothetical protein